MVHIRVDTASFYCSTSKNLRIAIELKIQNPLKDESIIEIKIKKLTVMILSL